MNSSIPDSSFNEKPTKWSILFCYIAAPERGQTEFVDGRAVYAALPDDMKARLDGMTAEHNFWVSRERGGYAQSDAVKAAVRSAVQPVVRTSRIRRQDAVRRRAPASFQRHGRSRERKAAL